MSRIIIKKVCSNCKHWRKTKASTVAKRLCGMQKEETYHYNYCPLWELNTRTVSINKMKKYSMEK